MIGIVCEGITDYHVLKNIIIGYKKDQSFPITKIRPEDSTPFGCNNLLHFISTDEFKKYLQNFNKIIIQIDSDSSESWGSNYLVNINNQKSKAHQFIIDIINVLINQIGTDYYNQNSSKIVFAICVHQIECWLLSYYGKTSSDKNKIVNCFNTLESISIKNGFSLSQKNYCDGKHYIKYSKAYNKYNNLVKASSNNASLDYFVKYELIKI